VSIHTPGPDYVNLIKGYHSFTNDTVL